MIKNKYLRIVLVALAILFAFGALSSLLPDRTSTKSTTKKPTSNGSTNNNTPIVYNVDSIDDLPETAVEGSVAFVKSYFEILNFVFYDELDTDSIKSEWGSTISQFEILYECNGFEYPYFSVVSVGSSSWNLDGFTFRDDYYSPANSPYVYYSNPNNVDGYTQGWQDELYKNIKIYSASAEAIQWLELHGTISGSGEYIDILTTYIYLFEDGIWKIVSIIE